jgi:diguanylate cyclase (GGDEF)-like protein
MQDALQVGDAPSLRQQAHSLKSASANLGAKLLSKECAALEAVALAGELEAAAPLADAIARMLPPVLQALALEAGETRLPQFAAEDDGEATVDGQHSVLVVDDEPGFLATTVDVLGAAGLAVERADNGRAALMIARRRTPSLVLLDALMPGYDGFETCQQMRELPGMHGVPILMVTGLEDMQSVNRAFEVGADGFIVKPVNYPVLVHQIRFHLRSAQDARVLRESQVQLSSAQRMARLGYWRFDVQSGQLECSDQLARLLDWTENTRPDGVEALIALAHPDDRQRVRDQIESALAGDHPGGIDFRVEWRDRDGMNVYQQLEWLDAGEAGGVLLGTVQDVTRQREAEDRIRRLAYQDSLTGLASRASFQQQIDISIKNATRRDEQLCLMYFDLDGFKEVNDTLGHDAGDEMLKAVARRLRATLRESDFAARLGGDEFCVILHNIKDSLAASEAAERCLEAINQPLELHDHEVTPRVSIGIALYPRDGRTWAELLKSADRAMYHAKHAGKNTYAFYQSDMNQASEDRLLLETQLRDALLEDQFELHYQPQVSLLTGRMVGVEAMLRWRHPERGLLAASEFIKVAERIGMMPRIDRWVLDDACQQAERWRAQFGGEVRLAVNLSPANLARSGIVDDISAALSASGLPAHLLEVDITEETILHAGGDTQVVEKLGQMGVRIAVDDFGTGNSSLFSFKHLKIARLKLDGVFIRELLSHTDTSMLLGTIISLGHGLGMEVLAEGVESVEQLQVLVGIGCDQAQGILLGEPVPAAGIPPLLDTRFQGLAHARQR